MSLAFRYRLAFLSAIVAVSLATPASATELPSFQEGLWEYHHTVNGETTKTKVCANPTEEMKQQNVALERALCHVTPLKKSGETYSYTAECSMRDINSRTTSTMTVKGADAYQLQSDGMINEQSVEELLVAKRLGPCKP
jgi:hypothetical protein